MPSARWHALLRTLVLSFRFFPRLAFFSLIAVATLWPALTAAGSLNEARDAQFLQAYEQHAVHILRDYGQVPLWDPYSYGGVYAFGIAQTRFAAPTVVLSLVLGSYRATAVIAYLLMIVGMEGAYRYMKLRAGASLGCLLTAPLFAMTGYFALAYFWGWLWFWGSLLLPWALYGTSRAFRGQLTGAVIVAGVFVFLLGFGAAYAIPMTALYCAVEVARSAAERRARVSVWVTASTLFCAAAFAAGLSAFRLWPMIDFMASSPRVMAGSPGNSVSGLVEMLFSPATEPAKSREGMTYVGTWGLVLILAGLVRRRTFGAVPILLLSVWTATGYASGISPFIALRELPIFSTLRYPERYLPFGFLFALELAAAGTNALVALALRRAKWFAVLPIALVTLQAFQLAGNFHHVIHSIWRGTPPERVDRPFKQSRGNRWAMAYYGPIELGSMGCAEGLPVPQSERLRGDLREEQYLLDPDAGRIESSGWTPERLDFRVALDRPTSLLVNQNYHPGWHTTAGSVRSSEGLLAVDLPAGRSDVTLRFLPRSAVAGSVTSLSALLSLCLLCVYVRRESGKKRGKIAVAACIAACVPLPMGAASAAILPEPTTTPVARNANGAEVVLEELPSSATPLSAEFEAAVEIVGVSVPATAHIDDEVPLEIYFRVTGAVPRAVGVFVHVEGPKRLQLDHEVVGASMFLGDAPRGKVLRDAFAFHADGKPGRYRVYVGLWQASGNGRRLDVRSRDRAVKISEGRVEIGALELTE